MADQVPPRQDPPLHQPHQAPEKPVKNSRLDEPARRALCTCITTVLLLVGLLVLVLWLVYRPAKPHFSVTRASVYGLNATTPLLMSTTMQFTILIRNPNRRSLIYFDTLSAFVSYRNQDITPPVALPPLYIKKQSSVSLSPMIGGSPVPVSGEVSKGFKKDEAYGMVGVKLTVQGRLRWKTGAVRTAHYEMSVKCDIMMGLKKGVSGEVSLIGDPACYVDI